MLAPPMDLEFSAITAIDGNNKLIPPLIFSIICTLIFGLIYFAFALQYVLFQYGTVVVLCEVLVCFLSHYMSINC